jgi:hypothetical protein
MNNMDDVFEFTKQSLTNFENIKECIQGIYEVLKINLSHENIYFQIGQDNLEALYQNLLELMVNDLGTIEFMKKLKNAEIDLDLPLDNLLR